MQAGFLAGPRPRPRVLREHHPARGPAAQLRLRLRARGAAGAGGEEAQVLAGPRLQGKSAPGSGVRARPGRGHRPAASARSFDVAAGLLTTVPRTRVPHFEGRRGGPTRSSRTSCSGTGSDRKPSRNTLFTGGGHSKVKASRLRGGSCFIRFPPFPSVLLRSHPSWLVALGAACSTPDGLYPWQAAGLRPHFRPLSDSQGKPEAGRWGLLHP